MAARIALLLCILFIVCVYIIDCKRKPDVSRSLWLPLIWMMIIASRPVSTWVYQWNPSLGMLGTAFQTPYDIVEGSPIDRTVFAVLIVASLFILLGRKIDWSQIIGRNKWILLFFLYGGISILWSDFPFVSLKRWVKAVGELLIVLVVLTEVKPVEALETLVRRCGFVLIPLSVVLIKYYPDLGRLYEPWTGAVTYCGVGYNKNSLGILCLVCGLVFLWNLLTTWNRRSTSYYEKKELVVDILFLGMIFWLFIKANSATSHMCFIVGWCILLGMGSSIIKGKEQYIGIFILVTVGVFLIFELSFGISRFLVSSLGREMTLTGRTGLWKELIEMQTDPLIGTGFESFWLGDRWNKLWEKHWWIPNQAHNGYLEIYLNLGWIGLLLLIGVISSCYRNICRSLMYDFDYGRLRMAILGVALLYAMTEAAFRELSPMWLMFLLIAVDPPRRIEVSQS